MTKITCQVTLSEMNDVDGYQLNSVEVSDFQALYNFLQQNQQRSKIQKITLKNNNNIDDSMVIVVDSLVKK